MDFWHRNSSGAHKIIIIFLNFLIQTLFSVFFILFKFLGDLKFEILRSSPNIRRLSQAMDL
jgi:hypothetical protein